MGRETRERILESAARLFGERGFDGTSIAMVLEDCGVNSGSLYHFFRSKEALALAVIERCVDRLSQRLLDRVETMTEAPLERVSLVVDAVRSQAESSGLGDGITAWLLAGEVGRRMPLVRQEWARYCDELAGRVRTWLDAAGPRLPSYLDRSGFSDYLATTLLGGLARSRADGDSSQLEKAVDQLEQHLGLLLDAARTERPGAPAPPPGATERPPDTEAPGDWRSW